MDEPGSAPIRPDRRRLLGRLGWGGLSLLLLSTIPATGRFLRPRRVLGGGRVVDVGVLLDYRTPAVSTRWVNRYGLWVVHRDGRLYALEARCTHLGCTPRWTPARGVFRCPCHGSCFAPDGEALNGPAVLPLARLAIRVEADRVIVDPERRARLEDAERDPRFFIPV
jgi:cytochrome b6-f complex iron-sulfur subunit